MDPWIMAGGVLVVLAVGFWFARNRSFRPEVSIGPLLRRLDESYTVLTGSILQEEQGMICLDYAVVSPYGVFVIKECREPGRVEVRLTREEWRVTGGPSKKIYNPVWDLRKIIGKLDQLVGKYPYVPVVVFSRARLTGDRDFNIMEAGKLPDHIQSFHEKRLSDADQEKIAGILS